jgi:hypothetical protein
MSIEQQDSNPRASGQEAMTSGSKIMAQARPTRTTSPRKAEANRRNAQRSTGPKTLEGKTKSSQNSTTHGIFVKQFLNGASPETVVEIEALAAGIREHYQPQGQLEEILVQKIVVETARYGRALGFEDKQFAHPHAFHIGGLDRMCRYTTSTSRALFRAIEELDRFQAARKAGQPPAAPSQVAAEVDANLEEGQSAPPSAHDDSCQSILPSEPAGDLAT